MESVASMLNVQNSLDRAQTIPVVGPLFVSPVLMLVSMAQTIIGLVASIFCSLGVILSCCYAFNDAALISSMHAGLGFQGLGKSFTNMLTLGIVGYIATQPARDAERFITQMQFPE